MARSSRNRLYRAWLTLEAADRNNADAMKAVGPGRQLCTEAQIDAFIELAKMAR